MRTKHDARDCLADIIENAVSIATYIEGTNRGQFERGGLVRDAVERCLERICEAAHRLGDRAPQMMPAQPWAEVRGMGNRLRHGYDDVKYGVVWETVTHGVPALHAAAKNALAELGEGDCAT